MVLLSFTWVPLAPIVYMSSSCSYRLHELRLQHPASMTSVTKSRNSRIVNKLAPRHKPNWPPTSAERSKVKGQIYRSKIKYITDHLNLLTGQRSKVRLVGQRLDPADPRHPLKGQRSNIQVRGKNIDQRSNEQFTGHTQLTPDIHWKVKGQI